MTKKKEKSIIRFIMTLFYIMTLGASIFAIYEIYLLESVEDLIRYIVMGVLVFIDLLFLWRLRVHKKKKDKKKKLYFIFIILYIIICMLT